MKEDNQEFKLLVAEQTNELRALIPAKEFHEKMGEMNMYASLEAKKKRIERQENKENKGIIYELENDYYLSNQKIFAAFQEETDMLKEVSERLECHIFKMS